MKQFFGVLALAMACAACKPEPAAPAATEQPPAPRQCSADTDCDGNEICDTETCAMPRSGANPIQPGAPGASAPSAPPTDGAQASTPPPGSRAMAESGDLVPGIPTCKPDDNRTPIPVWKPTVDAENTLSVAPPQTPDQVVALELEVHTDANCNDSDLNVFKIANPGDAGGGVQVTVRGNSQEIDGVCHLSGLYRNAPIEDKKLARQAPKLEDGWNGVHFSAADASEVASSNRYCVQTGG